MNRPSSWEDPPEDPDHMSGEDLDQEHVLEPEDDLDFEHQETRDCDYWNKTT